MAIRLMIVDDCLLRRTALAHVLHHTGRYRVCAQTSLDLLTEKCVKIYGVNGAILAIGGGQSESIAIVDSLRRVFRTLRVLAYAVGPVTPSDRQAWERRTCAFLSPQTVSIEWSRLGMRWDKPISQSIMGTVRSSTSGAPTRIRSNTNLTYGEDCAA